MGSKLSPHLNQQTVGIGCFKQLARVSPAKQRIRDELDSTSSQFRILPLLSEVNIIAKHDPPMGNSASRSEAEVGVDKVEAKLLKAGEQLCALEFSAPITRKISKEPKPVNSVRVSKTEVDPTKEKFPIGATANTSDSASTKELCWNYNSDAGCRRGEMCRYVHKFYPAVLQRKLATTDRAMENFRQFYEIRSEIATAVVKVEKKMKNAEAISLDLVIVMDCTFSMSPWITKAKSSIISIIDNVKLDHPNATDIRVGVVAYRDFCDCQKRLQIHTLTKNVRSIRTFIGSLVAFGGGDGPEDIPGGLEAALNMPFRSNAKRLVLVTDSPCHGDKFHDESGDDDMSYRTEIEQSPDICAQIRELAERGIDFTFIEVKPFRTAKMAKILREEFNKVGGFDSEFETVPLSVSRDIARLPSVIRSSASSSISKSIASSTVSSTVGSEATCYQCCCPPGRITKTPPRLPFWKKIMKTGFSQ